MGKLVQNKWGALILIAVCAAAGFVVFLIRDGYFLDRWQDKTVVCDLNGDGSDEVIKLANRHASVSGNGVLLWQSDDDWKVADVLVEDINRDGIKELLVLCWKRGSYGEYIPFWEEKNDREYSQHIFIYQSVEDGLEAVWMSSRLKPQVISWKITEDNLIHIVTDQGEDTVWMWDQWGLERVK